MADALGRVEAEQEAGVAAPVVADQLDLVQAQLVEQGDDVGRRVPRFRSARRAPRSSRSRAGRGRSPGVRGQRRDHLAPDPPVLRPAVQEQDRRPLPRFGDVQAHAGHVDVAVGDSVDLRGGPYIAVNLSGKPADCRLSAERLDVHG